VPSKSSTVTDVDASAPMSWNSSCAFGAMPSASSWLAAVGVEARYVLAPNTPEASPTSVPVVCVPWNTPASYGAEPGCTQ
jgi:hypothetical protein